MTKLIVVLASSLWLTACADGGPSPPDASTSAQSPGQIATLSDMPSLVSTGSGTNDCDLLPCDGACSLACDPEAMGEQYVTVGACALFACPLSDGRTMLVEACHEQ